MRGEAFVNGKIWAPDARLRVCCRQEPCQEHGNGSNYPLNMFIHRLDILIIDVYPVYTIVRLGQYLYQGNLLWPH